MSLANSLATPLGWTLLLSLGSTILALILGIPLGFWVGSLSGRIRNLVAPILALPFFLPSLLVGVIAVPFLNRDETSTVSLALTLIGIQGFINVGFVALIVQSNLSGIPAAHRDSALLEGATSTQIALRVEIPQLRGALAAVAVLIALYSATNYSLARLIGRGYVSTLEIEIAKFAFQDLNYGAAMAVSGLHLVLTVSMFIVAGQLGGHKLGLGLFGEGSTSDRAERRPPVGIFLALCGALFTILVAYGLLSPVGRSLQTGRGIGLQHYLNLGSRGERDILDVTLSQAAINSLRNLVFTMLIALPLAMLLARMRGRWSKFARALGIWPAAISPVVLGLATLIGTSQLGIRATEAWMVLPLVQALVVLPLLTLLFAAAYESMDADLIDAAAMDGAGPRETWWFIELPSLRAPLASGTLFASLAALGEFSAASFLTVGSQTTLPVAMYQLAARPGYENLGMSMAAATLFIGFALVVLLLQRRIVRS